MKKSFFVLFLVFLTACTVQQTTNSLTSTKEFTTAPTITTAPTKRSTATLSEKALIFRATQTGVSAKKTERFEEEVNSLSPAERAYSECFYSSGIRYSVEGVGVYKIFVTSQNDKGGTEQGEFNVPFCKAYNNFSNGDFLYISAQITSGEGSITCKIYEGTRVIAEAIASGFASIATCSGTKP